MKPTVIAAAGLAAALTASMAAGAWAHTPYLLPNTFDAERGHITLQAAATDEDFFNPNGSLNIQALIETLPSGEQARLAPTAVGQDVTLIEAPLEAGGSYRFSTGQAVGRTTSLAKVEGRWLMVRRPQGEGPPPPRPAAPTGPPAGPPSIAEADIPAGAERMTTQSVQIAETYVSKGAPTDAALKTAGQGFELKAITHPNSVYVDQGFAFQLLLDGKGVAGAPIAVYRAGDIYDDRRIVAELKTDANGEARIPFAQPGVYLLAARYPVAARAPGEPPPAKTYAYSLTFEVTR